MQASQHSQMGSKGLLALFQAFLDGPGHIADIVFAA
jgi:hypothetical protein